MPENEAMSKAGRFWWMKLDLHYVLPPGGPNNQIARCKPCYSSGSGSHERKTLIFRYGTEPSFAQIQADGTGRPTNLAGQRILLLRWKILAQFEHAHREFISFLANFQVLCRIDLHIF
jgi:hypothetical protein